MHIVVIAGGAAPTLDTTALGTVDLVIAVDGGAVHADQLGLTPDILIGDFDSITPDRLDAARAAGTEIVEFPADKDATDLELAMELALARGGDQISVVALFGGRLDHELANIALLASPRWAAAQVCGLDDVCKIAVVRSTVTLHEPVGATVSVLPWGGDADGVSTQGLQWPLSSEILAAGTTRGVSNVCELDHQTVSVADGTLLVIADRRGP